MRRKMIESDVVEAVIGLGPNLFYNSPMEACLLITNNNKSAEKKGKILFINAVKEVRQEKTMSFLTEHQIEKIYGAFTNFKDDESFAKLVIKDTILKDHKGNLSISLYVRPDSLSSRKAEIGFQESYENWQLINESLHQSMNTLFLSN